MKVLVTGAAGFIGSHVALKLLARGDNVVGIDNFNDYYDVALKRQRSKRISDRAFSLSRTGNSLTSVSQNASFNMIEMDVSDKKRVSELFEDEQFECVVHLAAQAGVRHSLTAPFDYVDSNITGFLTILEGCRHSKIQHLVYASTSSVYGANTNMPFQVADPADHPVALYGATKRANELMAHSYSHLFGLPTSGLRFFTVYGPWGRPDMALFLFTKAILAGEPIQVFNNGQHVRDFTYIDDIVNGIVAVLDQPAMSDPDWDSSYPNAETSQAPWRIHNIGNGQPVELMQYIEMVEKNLGKKAIKEFLPMQAGDIIATHASVDTLAQATEYQPTTSIEDGVRNFVEWYLKFQHNG